MCSITSHTETRLNIGLIGLIFFLILTLSGPTGILNAAPTTAYSVDLNMAEPGFEAALGTPDITPLPDGVYLIDVVTPGTPFACSGGADITPYSEAADGISDIRLTVTQIDGNGGRWNQDDAAWDDSSTNSLRSDWSISDQKSQPNDYGYVKFNVEFINGLEDSVSAESFSIRVTSTNGSSEAYEWAMIIANGADAGSITNAAIAAYTNDDYQDGTTISEHLSGLVDGDGTPGGLVKTGWWAIDDFNTTVLAPPSPEAVSTNPDAGNGSVNDDQTVTGTKLNLAPGVLISKFAVYFGLTDVAYDTSGDGFTRTNSLPAASFTDISIGFDSDESCPTAIELTHFTATALPDNSVALDWETSLEIDHAGFNIYRREVDSRGDWNLVNTQLIASRGIFGGGSTYALTDTQLGNKKWAYLLEDVDIHGVRIQHRNQIETVDFSDPTAVSLISASAENRTAGFSALLASTLLALGTTMLFHRRKSQKPQSRPASNKRHTFEIKAHESAPPPTTDRGYVTPTMTRYSAEMIENALASAVAGGSLDPLGYDDPFGYDDDY